MSRAGRSTFSLREMRAMFQAIVKGDGRAARKAAERHVQNAAAAARETFDLAAPPRRRKSG